MSRVLFRARSGPAIGMGHAMRTRAVAQEVLARGGQVLMIVDDADTRESMPAAMPDAMREGFEVVTIEELPGWTRTPASGAWLDGFCDWTPNLESLEARGTFSILVENRTPARDHCDRLLYPALHYSADGWDRRHPHKVLAGAEWIPLGQEVRQVRAPLERDVDLLVTFGGSDPNALTERALGALDLSSRRVVVSVGPHMEARLADIEALAERGADVRVLSPGTPLPLWMARSKAALTALGTTLYELAYLGVPALILANHEYDHDALDYYAGSGPHLPLGVAAELSHEGLRAALASGLAAVSVRTGWRVPRLGDGARRIADLLLGGASLRRSA